MFSANSSQVSGDKLFVEDVFSTYLYTGNGGAQTINNGIDLTGKGGLVWLKMRRPGSGWSFTQSHALFDTVRGDDKYLSSDLTNGQYTFPNNGITFNSSGFGIDAASYFGGSGDQSTSNFASWTFREAPKFFDVVTYTGNGVSGRAIPHNLGIAPGMMIIKRTDSTSDWAVYHRSLGPPATNWWLKLNLFDGQTSASAPWADTDPTATTFTVSANAAVNASGATYVAYLYAHDAASDGIIQCGSYTQTGSAVTVNLGWEPQWLMVKRTDGTGNWVIIDNMRALNMSTTNGAVVFPNTSGAETNDPYWHPTATGFVADPYWGSGASVVYIAIRRGPMRTPTLGTSVFQPVIYTGDGTTVRTVNTTITPDAAWFFHRNTVVGSVWDDRLRGNSRYLQPCNTNAEASLNLTAWGFDIQNAVYLNSNATYTNANGELNGLWALRRAPGFFDTVCYTGNGVNGRTINHNLGVTPELMIMKNRSSAGYNWFTWDKSADLSQANALLALSNAAGRPAFSSGNLNSTVPTSTVFTIGGDSNASGGNYVTYLFASCPGVSNVGSYTGNGSSQTINCGFAAGARFVMIKRTNAAGDWYVWDTARGIVAGNDPHLSLNTTAAEVTSNDTIDTDSSGFVVNQDAATNVNVNAATYIYLAIA